MILFRILCPLPVLAAISFVAFLFGACHSASSQSEKDLRSNLYLLNDIFQEFYRIPVKQKNFKTGTISWKDPNELRALYEKYRKQITAMDGRLLTISKTTGRWADDAAFARAVLHVLWSLVSPNRETVERAILLLNEFPQPSSGTHLEEITKTTMEAFLRICRMNRMPISPYESMELNF